MIAQQDLLVHTPVITGGQQLVIQLKIGALPISIVTVPERFARITRIHMTIYGTDSSDDCMQFDDSRPALTIEAIADWVAGDGTDAQRVAIADGIRAGLPLQSPAKVEP